MIVKNATPRLIEAFDLANKTQEPQRVTFIYNELNTHDTIVGVFEWLYRKSIPFQTRYEEYRFVIIVHPELKS